MADIQTILERAGSELVDEEARLVEQVKQQQAKVRELESQLKQVREALARLGLKSKKKKSRQQAKPAPKREEVAAAVEQVLAGGGVKHPEVLEEEVAEVLAEQGKSRMGLKLRLKEALRDERFVEDEDGYRLAEAVGVRPKRTAK